MKPFLPTLVVSALTMSSIVAQSDLNSPQWIGPHTGMNVLADWTATEVLSQGATGTCWSYSTTSFMESEAFRITGELHDFSEMSSVRVNYPRKAAMYLRYQGNHQFGPGALSHDVVDAVKAYGLLPASVYDGQPGEGGRHDHGELDGLLKAMVDAALAEAGHITPNFMAAFEAVLDTYLGALPSTFRYNGKEYDAASFRDAMGIDPDAYVELSSFTHQPLHQSFVLEVPDNYSNGTYFNLTLDELVDATVRALESGYTVAWDADVSNPGFSFQNGVALALKDRGALKEWDWSQPLPEEMEVSEDSRQLAYDELSTTDDHLMHFVGLAEREVNGEMKRFFILKNSWGTGNEFGGRQFVSEAYFRMYTIGVLLHEDALSTGMRRLLGDSKVR